MKYKPRLSLLDLLASTLIDPYGSMQHVLAERERPPYLLALFIVLIAVLVVPGLLVQLPELSSDGWPSIQARLNVALTAGAIISLFLVLTFISLRLLLRFATTFWQLCAITLYAATPSIPLALGYYAANYLLFGKLTVLSYLITGQFPANDWFIQFLPYFVYLSAVWSTIVFLQGLRVSHNTTVSSAALGTLVAVLVMFGSYTLVNWCGNVFFPEPAQGVRGLLRLLTFT